MSNADLLTDMENSLRLGLLSIYGGVNDSADRGLLFFDEVPKSALNLRASRIAEGRGGEQWFLVTDRPRGSEWKDELLDRYGLWVSEVEDLAAARRRLEEIASERKHEDLQAREKRLARIRQKIRDRITQARTRKTGDRLAEDAVAERAVQVMAGQC